jgi:hypothetical protein
VADKTSLYACLHKKCLYLQVVGWASAAISSTVYGLIDEAATNSISVAKIDLSRCSWIDSTFAGSMLRFVPSPSVNTEIAVTLVRPSSECLNSLTTMCLDRILSISDEEVDVGSALQPVPLRSADGIEQSLHIATAHRRLADVSDECREIFGRIAEAMEADVARQQSRNDDLKA